MRRRIVEAITPEMFDEAVRVLCEKVLAGDTAALKMFFQYTAGKPLPCNDPDRIGLHEAGMNR